ncbi:MAG: acyltransferase family protein [Deltaproteobacteria bacterium]|nr:acyltransferase family protein [Deltaproteobacteria bacterium]
MSNSVLGRDPFASPGAEPAPPKRKSQTKPKAKAAQAKAAQAKAAQAKTTQAKTTQAKTTQAKTTQAKQEARVKKAPVKPAGASPRLPGWSRPKEPDRKRHEIESYDERIDCQELLHTSGDTIHPLRRALQQSTFFLQPSFYGRKLGQWALKHRSLEVDSFGFDRVYAKKAQSLLDSLYDKYWRVEVLGAEHLPDRGRVMLVANHSGGLPYDGLMLKLAVERAEGRLSVRFLLEDFVFHFPFLGAALNRLGGVRASQDNARRLLEFGQTLAVFPEGAKGLGKLFGKRYQLQRFGRGGFVKLALRTGATILPVAIVGAEEVHPMLGRARSLARLLDLPYIPLTPTFPWLGPLGLLPLPSKWMIQIGPPMDLEGAGPEAADDPIRVMAWSEQARSTIQDMLDKLRRTRGHVFLGPGTLDADPNRT